MTYQPLKIGESNAKLTATANQLGAFPYQLQLTAYPPAPEPYLEFDACLGQTDQRRVTISTSFAVSDFCFTVSKIVIVYYLDYRHLYKRIDPIITFTS